jgi:DNA segregation ATPase FtsK/SpoIIIE, S-DNA-T family
MQSFPNPYARYVGFASTTMPSEILLSATLSRAKMSGTDPIFTRERAVPERNHRLDLVSAGLAVVALFLAISLASFDPADPPSDHVYPPNATVRNACGRVGAWIASPLVELLGIASFGVIGWTVLASLALALRLPRGVVARQAIGGTALLFAVAAGADRLQTSTGFETIAGAGGTVGFFLANHLHDNLSHAGSGLLLASVGLLGSVLILGSYAYVLLGAMKRSAGRGARGMHAGLMGAIAWLRRPRPVDEPETNLEEIDAEESKETLEEEGDDESEESDELDESVEEELEDEEETVPIVRTGFDQVVMAKEQEEEPEKVVEKIHKNFKLPSLDNLDDQQPFELDEHESEIRERAKLLERTFLEFEMKVKVVQIDTGPVVTQYEIELEPGLRARRVIALSDDIAIALKASSVRIVAPLPGKNTVGIEVPNARRAKVGLKEVMLKSQSMMGSIRLPMFLGKDVKGLPMVNDLASMPHLLIAGRTGTGKSVCLNTLILSILMTKTPEQVKMLMIDPKMVELSLYKSIPHLMHPVVTDMKKAEAILAWAVEKMEERYALLARVGVRHIDSYNALPYEQILQRLGLEEATEEDRIPKHMPYILIFADEMADLMMTAAKEVEAHIIRLAQKSRAVGIHLILATQKPTVDVITGLIKSNLPARIAFQVASRTDSRVVLDEMGADKLLGNGDMLFLSPGTSKITRAQGTFVSDEEVNRVVEYLSTQARPQFSQELMNVASAPRGEAGQTTLPNRDDMYEAAVEVIVREQRGSVSLIQRALGLGYGRAARLIDYMAEDGIVGDYNGSQAREVLVKPDQWDEFRRSRFARAS